MTCFPHFLNCWTRPWRCRKVQQPPEFWADRSEAPKVHHPQVDDATATILVDYVDDDGSSEKKQKIWKKGGNGAGDLHGALGILDGYADELWPATRGLGWVNPVP